MPGPGPPSPPATCRVRTAWSWATRFASWVGWLLPFDAPLVLVVGEGQDAVQAAVALGRIGFDDVRGVAPEQGLQGPLRAFRTVDVAAFAAAIRGGVARQVLDVRAPREWRDGHLDGSVHRYLPDLVAAPPPLDRDEPVWVACASGYRATAAASLLERHGYEPVVLTDGGVADVSLLHAEP